MAPRGWVLPRAPVVCWTRGGGGSKNFGFPGFEILRTSNRVSLPAGCALKPRCRLKRLEGHKLPRASRLTSYTSHANAPSQNLAPDHGQSRIPT